MISTLLIALREGLEAALIVGILAGALQGAGRSIRPVQIGVSAAVLSSLLFGAILFTTARELPSAAEEAFVGIASLLAVGLVTWMVFWMRNNARTLKSDLSQRLNLAISPFAVQLSCGESNTRRQCPQWINFDANLKSWSRYVSHWLVERLQGRRPYQYLTLR